jgi:hypothetical protein
MLKRVGDEDLPVPAWQYVICLRGIERGTGDFIEK